jgi:hypothetical protein
MVKSQFSPISQNPQAVSFFHFESENGARVVYQQSRSQNHLRERVYAEVRFSPVYAPILICVFAVALFFVTILFITNTPRKPGDQAQPLGYKRKDDERQKGDQASCRVVG